MLLSTIVLRLVESMSIKVKEGDLLMPSPHYVLTLSLPDTRN